MGRWGIIIVLSLLLTGCYSLETASETFFRSDECHLEVTLPPGWAAAGPEALVPRISGLVAFNSWGEAGFWGREVGGKYGSETTMEQVPHLGAYVQLVEVVGPATPGREHYAGEHEQEDLGGLWEEKDWRVGETIQGYTGIGFYKWGRSLGLGVYCDQDASDATVEAVNALLESWRFDAVVPGDVGWAAVEARHLLPLAVEPMKFPIPHLEHRSPITKFPEEHESIARVTQATVRDETVVVKFMYRWNDPKRDRGPECPSDRCHWWIVEAWPSGEIVLTEEGGAVLPGRRNERVSTWFCAVLVDGKSRF